MRKQGVEQKRDNNNSVRRNGGIEKWESQKSNQTVNNGWIKISGSKTSIAHNDRYTKTPQEKLNQLQLIGSGGLSSSFYDQLLLFSRQRNGQNLIGEREKSRTSESDIVLKNEDNENTKRKLNDRKKVISNGSVPLHSLTRLQCDHTRNCAKNQAAEKTHNNNNMLNLFHVKDKTCTQMFFIFAYYCLWVI